MSIDSDEIVHLNVGGIKYQTSRSTLATYESSVLKALFSKNNDDLLGEPDEKTKEYFIDADGEVFRHILQGFRRRNLNCAQPPPNVSQDVWLVEVGYWCPSLLQEYNEAQDLKIAQQLVEEEKSEVSKKRKREEEIIQKPSEALTVIAKAVARFIKNGPSWKDTIRTGNNVLILDFWHIQGHHQLPIEDANITIHVGEWLYYVVSDWNRKLVLEKIMGIKEIRVIQLYNDDTKIRKKDPVLYIEHWPAINNRLERQEFNIGRGRGFLRLQLTLS